MSKARRLGCSLVLMVLAVGAGWNITACRHAHSMLHYARGGTRTASPEALSLGARIRTLVFGVRIPRPADEQLPAVLAANARALTIRVAGGITLSAWHVDQGAAAPLMVFFHGYSTEKCRLLLEAREILAVGASVLLVDFRGSGGSSEDYATFGYREAEDVAAAVTFARERLPHSALILYGQSMGSAAILRAIHALGVQPDAVILESVFDTLLGAIRNRFRAIGVPGFPSAELLVFWGGRQFGFNGFAHNPVEYASALTCPALFLHGVDDPRATRDQARRVFAAAAGPKQFVEFENVGHASYAARHPAQWRAAVTNFLAPSLSPRID